MNFNFNATAGSSQSTSKPRLKGNDIYTVKFDECEVKDITGVKDPTLTYKTLVIKFSNEDGVFEHTVFEPRSTDFERGETEFTNKNGKIEKKHRRITAAGTGKCKDLIFGPSDAHARGANTSCQ